MAFHPFESGAIPGAVIVNVFAVLSTFALLSVAGRVVWLGVVIPLLKGDSARTPREYVFFKTQLGLYSICLLTANLFTSVAGVIGLSWLKDKGITEGTTCTAQAVMTQLGNFGTAYFTATIAVHTFNSLVLRRRQSVWLASTVIVIGWFFAVAGATFPMRRSQGEIYGDAGLACAIKGLYPRPQFFLHLFPIFFASFISVVMYSIVFLVLRGTLVIKGGIRLTLDPHQRWSGRTGTLDGYHHFIAAIARSMLWFPFAYIALLLPYSIVRLLALSGFAVSFGVTVFAFVCWFFLGFVNVLLLYNTSRVLRPAFDARLYVPKGDDTESFCSPYKATQATPSVLLTPGQILPSVMDEKMAYNFPNRHQTHSTAHKSTPSASSRASDHPLLSGHGYLPSNDSSASLLTAPSLQRTIFPHTKLNQQPIPMPEPAWRFRDLSVDADVVHVAEVVSHSPSLTPAPRYSRSPFEHRPTIESISSPTKPASSVDGLRFSFENLDVAGRLNHHRPPLSAVAPQTFYRPLRASTMTTSSDYEVEANHKPSLPPPVVVRSRQAPEYIFDHFNSAASSSTRGNVLVASDSQVLQPQRYYPGMMTRVYPAPNSGSADHGPPSVFDASAMLPSLTFSVSNPYAAQMSSRKHRF